MTKTVEADAAAYDKLDRVFHSLNEHYAKGKTNEVSHNEVDKLATELNSTLRQLKSRNTRDRCFTFICMILLVVGLVILSWNTFEIQYTFALRLMIFYVS